MKLQQFLKPYPKVEAVTLMIKGYCKEEEFDYLCVTKEDGIDFSGKNATNYIPKCLCRQPYWKDIKNKQVKMWCAYERAFGKGVGIYIELEEKDEKVNDD